ncbi:MAG: hypothetical protein NZ696_00700 [Thermomicrobium sp.]|nr:hypothetical protein [Thermomicrobium sp.]MDW7981788.1 hypothetical protein [Thermomicrobium sp.]
MQVQHRTSKRKHTARPKNASLVNASLQVLLAVGFLTWWLSLVARLGTIGSMAALSAPALGSGWTQLPDPRVETIGDWVVQTVGGSAFLSTRAAGDRVRFVFVGTELDLVARTGPDAGTVSVRIEESVGTRSARPPSTVILDLERSSARIETLPVINNAVPGLHAVEIRNEGPSEFALMAIIVRDRPTIWWAFIPPVVLGLIALTVVLARWWRAVVHALGWWRAGAGP